MKPLDTDFDTDTALEPIDDGLWRGHIDPSWFVVSGPNGGFLAALAARAVELRSERPPRSLTLHYLEAPVEGPIDVAATVERDGTTTSSLSVRMIQQGRTIALGLAACAQPREGQPSWHDAQMPRLPDPEDCEEFPIDHPRTPQYFRKYESRWDGAHAEDRPAHITVWFRTRDPRPLDDVLVAALTDAMMPPAFLRMSKRLFVPTIDLTIHWRSPLPEGEHPWVLGHFVTRVAEGGACEEDGELWSQDGRLLAQSRQLAIVREPRR